MGLSEALEIGRDGFWMALSTAAPILIIGLVVGLLISMFQAVTQLQEQTLTFVPKIAAMVIAAAIFIYFLAGNRTLYRSDGSKRLADNALVALTLLIAESRPEEKDTIVKVIVNLINLSND